MYKEFDSYHTYAGLTSGRCRSGVCSDVPLTWEIRMSVVSPNLPWPLLNWFVSCFSSRRLRRLIK